MLSHINASYIYLVQARFIRDCNNEVPCMDQTLSTIIDL